MPLKRIFPGTYPEVKNPDGTVSNIKTTVVGMDDSPPRISSEAEEVLRQMNSLTKQSDSFGKLPLH